MRAAQLTAHPRNSTTGPPQDPVASLRRDYWMHGAAVGTAIVLVLGFFPTFLSLVSAWASTGSYEYGFLVGPICVFLVWGRRDRLASAGIRPQPVGLLVVAVLCLIWLAGDVAAVNLARHLALLALVPALVYTLYGPEVVRVLRFALAYLLFAVPFGDFMVGPLQDVTAHLSVFALQFTNVPVYMAGRMILTPAATWHVAEACSGVKFFFATTAFGVLYAHLFFRSGLRRVIFIACAVTVPVLANGLRVFFTILIGERFGLEYATGTDHMIFGWQFFGLVLLLLFFAGWPWHEMSDAKPRQSRQHHDMGTAGRMSALAVAILASVILAAGPVWSNHVEAATRFSPAAIPATGLPDAFAGYRRIAATATVPDIGMNFENPIVGDHAYYGRNDIAVRIDYARYAGGADDDRELLTYGNRIFDSAQWHVVSRQQTRAGFERLVLGQNDGSRVVAVSYAYVIGDHSTASPLRFKLWQAWYGLRGVATMSAVWTLTEEQSSGQANAKAPDRLLAALEAFANAQQAQTP